MVTSGPLGHICIQERQIEHAPDEALGRSRRGFTTKLNLAGDGRGRQLRLVFTPRQRHESTSLQMVRDAIRVPRPGGRGRPRKRPDYVTADKGYRYPACRRLLRRRGRAHSIPERRDQQQRRSTRRGRPLAFDAARSRSRNNIERCGGELQHCTPSPPGRRSGRPTTARSSSSPPCCAGSATGACRAG